MAENLKEPQRDCILCRETQSSCRGLKKMYCAIEVNPCPFYKSKYEYDAAGRPLKGVNNGQ